MSIYATNENNKSNIEHQDLLKENPMFFDILTDISGSEMLPGIEVFKENKPGIFSARFKTHGYGIVITADNNHGGFFYSIAKPIYIDTDNEDDVLEMIEGPLNYDTAYIFKDALIQLMILK